MFRFQVVLSVTQVPAQANSCGRACHASEGAAQLTVSIIQTRGRWWRAQSSARREPARPPDRTTFRRAEDCTPYHSATRHPVNSRDDFQPFTGLLQNPRRGKLSLDMIAECRSLGLAFLTAVGVGGLLLPGLAAQSETSTAIPASAGQLESVRLGLITKTTALIGAKVRDRGDSSHGKMEDVILDLSTGRAVAALFGSGSDHHVTPVPARSFWTATRNKIMVNADKKRLKAAPCIPKTDLGRPFELKRLSPSFNYFGQALPQIPDARSGELSSAAEIVRQRLLSQSGQPLGQVEDIMLDLPVGRVVYLVIQPAAGADSLNIRYLVPPQAVRADATSPALVLNADRAHFLAGPHFQKEYWTDVSRLELSMAVLQHYNLQTSPSQSDSKAKPVVAPLVTAGRSSQIAPARSDQEITQSVVTEIVRNNNAFPTRDLRITTSNGRVTLAGRVRNEKQKRQLATAAARVVGAENVINQLRTQSAS
jgi:sporulation protein YlmC with PRC-barrel domain